MTLVRSPHLVLVQSPHDVLDTSSPDTGPPSWMGIAFIDESSPYLEPLVLGADEVIFRSRRAASTLAVDRAIVFDVADEQGLGVGNPSDDLIRVVGVGRPPSLAELQSAFGSELQRVPEFGDLEFIAIIIDESGSMTRVDIEPTITQFLQFIENLRGRDFGGRNISRGVTVTVDSFSSERYLSDLAERMP